jgi:hypothetical protein
MYAKSKKIQELVFIFFAQSKWYSEYIQTKIMQKWSAKDYNYVDYPSDKLFLNLFMKFETG